MDGPACENIQVSLRSYIGISQTPKPQTTKHDRQTQNNSTSKSLISESLQVSEAPFTTHQTEKCQLSVICSLYMLTPLLLEQKVKSVDQKLSLQRSNEFKSNQPFKKHHFSHQTHMLLHALKANQPCCHHCIIQTVETRRKRIKSRCHQSK